MYKTDNEINVKICRLNIYFRNQIKFRENAYMREKNNIKKVSHRKTKLYLEFNPINVSIARSTPRYIRILSLESFFSLKRFIICWVLHHIERNILH